MNETKATEVQHLHEVEELRQRVAQQEQRIAESTQREEELQKERDFSSTVLSIIDALVVVGDREGRIVRWNHACQQLFGLLLKRSRAKRFGSCF